MATVDENLKTFLLADSTVKRLSQGRICENHVPQGPNGGPYLPYVFFYLSAESDDTALDDANGRTPNRTHFFVECYGQGISASRALGNAVRSRLDLYRGSAFGDQTAQGVFCASVGDDYEPRGAGADQGVHGAHYAVEVVV